MITEEMIQWFNDRTNMHIDLVKKYANKIVEILPKCKELLNIVELHDKSKFEEPEHTPYIYTTWKYKCDRDNIDYDIPDDISDKAHEATIHHIMNNKHHPEFWDKNFNPDTMFNRKNRDATSIEMVDATNMNTINILELVADWCAVSDERKSCPIKWADMNINKRWKFTDKQEQLIRKLINKVFYNK